MSKKHGLLRITLLLILSTFTVITCAIGQGITLGAINHGASKNTQARQLQIADTLNLPFWDDFSQSSGLADSALWLHSNTIYINNGLAYLPPSYNVATLDAFDASGSAYSTDSRVVGVGDSLVSQAMDLSTFSTLDNISLSFFWQQGYGRTAPDSEDSLRLYFKNDSNRWVAVFAVSGSGNAVPLQFQQHFEQLNQASYLHAGFQFKFEYYGNLAGDFDSWSIDYVYLNEGNTVVSTADFAYDSYEDRTFSSIQNNLFNGHYGVPLKHLTPLWFTNNLSSGTLIYNNLWAGNGSSTIFGTEIFGSVRDTLAPNTVIDSVTVQGNFLTSAQDTALFNISINEPQNLSDYLLGIKDSQDSAYIETRFNLGNNDSLFFETVNGTTIFYPQYTFRANDTINQLTVFHDYYAYDDGSAEASIQVDSKNYQLAQQFNINGGHFMTGIDMYIPNLAQNNGSKNITLLVLDSVNGQNITDDIRIAQNVLVNPSGGVNQFQRFTFERPVFVEGLIFVGYREQNDEVVSIGFDKNTNSATQLYYNQSGIWEQNNTLQGSVMIRPVFGEITTIIATKPKFEQQKIQLWPNPNRGTLHVSEDFEQIFLFTLDGKLKWQAASGQANKALLLPNLAAGLYLVKVIQKDAVHVQKVIIQR